MSILEAGPEISLSIVFLNYNRVDQTRQTVCKLLDLVGDRPDIEIIAVDNGSTDGTREFLQCEKRIQSILLDENTGIAGYNSGFSRARGNYLLVLDDDSCPRDRQTVDRLIACMDRDSRIGLVACHIESQDGSAQWSWHLPSRKRFGPSPFFIGCGFCVRRELLVRIGGYPEDFFLYQNEIEVTFRIRQEGFLVYYDPESRVVHRGEPSSRPGWRRVYYPTRNTIRLIRTYYPQPLASYMIGTRLLIGLVRGIRFNEFSAWLKAVRDSWKKPVCTRYLSPEIRLESASFMRQNSLFHHLLGKL